MIPRTMSKYGHSAPTPHRSASGLKTAQRGTLIQQSTRKGSQLDQPLLDHRGVETPPEEKAARLRAGRIPHFLRPGAMAAMGQERNGPAPCPQDVPRMFSRCVPAHRRKCWAHASAGTAGTRHGWDTLWGHSPLRQHQETLCPTASFITSP